MFCKELLSDFLVLFTDFFEDLGKDFYSLCLDLKFSVTSRVRMFLKKVRLNLILKFIAHILLMSRIIARVPLAVMERMFCSSTGLYLLKLAISFSLYILNTANVSI